MIIAEYSSKSTILCYGIHFGHISINHLTMKLDYLDKKLDQKKEQVPTAKPITYLVSWAKRSV